MSRATKRLGTWLVIGGVLATLGLAGCGSSDDSAKSTSAGAPGRDANQANDAAPADGGAALKPEQAAPGQVAPPGQGTGAKAQTPAKLVPDERSIIYTGSINVRVSDVDAKAGEAITIAIAAGGFVAGDNRTANASRSEARIVLRVPSTKFTDTVTALGKLGKEESRALSTEDVTAEVVDLAARIATAQASVERVRALLARAATITEIVALEGEVSRREADLEALKARQRKLADLTALSTITAVLLGPDAVGPKVDKPATGFVGAMKSSWNALLDSLAVLLVILGALLPWLLVFGLPVFIVVWLARRNGTALRNPLRRTAPPPASDA